MSKKYNDPFVPIKPVDESAPTHYVNNKIFLEEVVKYREQYYAAIEAGLEKPRANRYLGECIYKIAHGLATKHNFRNYSYIDDMVSAGIEACISNLHMFNPEKSQNPFAYFTQSCYYAFLYVIKSEKREHNKKHRMILSGGVESFDTDEDDGEFTMSLNEYIMSFGNELHEEKKKKDVKPGPLEGFFE